jgi:hypothetical protein
MGHHLGERHETGLKKVHSISSEVLGLLRRPPPRPQLDIAHCFSLQITEHLAAAVLKSVYQNPEFGFCSEARPLDRDDIRKLVGQPVVPCTGTTSVNW